MENNIKLNFENYLNEKNFSNSQKEIKEVNFDNFIKNGFPNKRIEDWKFSDLNQIISQALSDPQAKVAKPKSHYSHRYFDHKTHISLSEDRKWQLTKLEINTLDKVGLLSNIAYVLYENNLSLINARVSTIGERVEDVFFISDTNHQPLSKIQQSSLKTALEERL